MLQWKEPVYYIVQTEEKLDELVKELQSSIEANTPISIDIETTGASPKSGLDYYHGWILGISFATSKDSGYYIPISHLDLDRNERSGQLSLSTVRSKLNPVLSSGGVYLGHNIKFDYKFLWKAGFRLYPQFWDTCIAVQLLNGNVYKTRALKKIITEYVDLPFGVVKSFSEVAAGDAAVIDPAELSTYAINDTIFTYYLYEAFKPTIDTQYKKIFYQAEMPLLPILAHMELRGVRINADYYKSIRGKIDVYRNKIREFFEQHYFINIASPPQVGKLFNTKFSTLALEKSDKGNIITDVDALQSIMRRYSKNSEVHKIAKRVVRFRELEKVLSTYIDKYPLICDQFQTDSGVDYILHTDYDQVKDSGRLSSSPNIQNIPRDGEISVRKGFIPRNGYKFVEADWSSAELRLVAVAAKESKMLTAYLADPRGADLHTLTAQGIFNKEKVTPEQRYIGKTMNFSVIYGGTEYTVSQTLNCPLDQARIYVQKFYDTYPDIMSWKRRKEIEIGQTGYAETFYGRKRFLPGDVTPRMQEKWKYYGSVRQLVNHIIQGTCADLLKLSLVDVTKTFSINSMDAYIVATTHDSIVVETTVPDEVCAVLKNVMEVTIEGVLMPIDIEVKNSFAKGSK